MIKKVVVKQKRKTAPPSISKLEKKNAAKARDLLALRLFSKGLSSEEIGKQLDPPVSALRASQILYKALEKRTAAAVDKYREREMMALDELRAGLYDAATGYTDDDGVYHPPDKQAVDRVRELIADSRKMNGLDKPAELLVRDGLNELLLVVKRIVPDKFGEICAELAKLNSAEPFGGVPAGTVAIPTVSTNLPN